MANPKHFEILAKGIDIWNDWRERNPYIVADLANVDLSGEDLSFFNFNNTDLSNANLSECKFDLTNFSLSTLNNANLWGVMLVGCEFRRTSLENASIIQSGLDSCFIEKVTFFRTNFSNCSFGSLVFCETDLSQVIGLETINHFAPSTIGIDTIYRSKGQIPGTFLRGCGVPQIFIDYLPSLTAQPIQYYSCFISYSSNDDDFAQRLYNDLQGKGVRCWFAPEDMKIGDRIRHRIDQSIRLHDKLLLILSEHSIASQWVEKEVETAFEKERRNPGKTVLFPIRVDDAVMDSNEAWAADIRRTRHIGDFSNWKDHDSYQKAFDRLMRDLKASEE